MTHGVHARVRVQYTVSCSVVRLTIITPTTFAFFKKCFIRPQSDKRIKFCKIAFQLIRPTAINSSGSADDDVWRNQFQKQTSCGNQIARWHSDEILEIRANTKGSFTVNPFATGRWEKLYLGIGNRAVPVFYRKKSTARRFGDAPFKKNTVRHKRFQRYISRKTNILNEHTTTSKTSSKCFKASS